ncbi:hypothetical protein FPRO06_02780 [Fusarium proliferatum]|nr:hypothetical protein FPRO03_12087 [Fusarium proliferatum]KAG4276570.1 hypothetical protein FPRO04_01068 [Fusarium proliferatum]KAG4290894.1 hypothetical protein FPRO06_02780 [Fusarium proliferatum]KAI1048375.1 hypothetical protein LB506_002448 [Fusarium annulatum]CVK93044.1 uncharacterized protein FPRN_04412 [Fusarium proliferatum]
MLLGRLPNPLRVLFITALYASTSSALPANSIFARQDTCDADQTSCNSDIANFCCPKGNSCRLLAGKTTAVCCPSGQTCNVIQPITCDIRGQDQREFPNAPVKTVVFNLDLEKCGQKCCPFGYSCEDEQCVIDKDQTNVPEGAELPNETSTPVPSAITTATGAIETISISAAPSTSAEPTAAVGSGNDSSDKDGDSKSDNSGPATTSIVGGVVGGSIILLIIAVVIFLYVRRQNKRDAQGSEKGSHIYGHGRRSTSDASFGNIISEPISQPNSYRADFILKTPSTQRSSIVPARQLSSAGTRLNAPPPRIRISIPNPFDSPNPSPNAQPSPLDNEESLRHGNVRLPPIRAMKGSSYCSRRPSTPELQREPSSENINVFADPSTIVKPRPLTRATTFTDLMDEADLGAVRRGKPYVPGTTPRI